MAGGMQILRITEVFHVSSFTASDDVAVDS